MERDALIAHGVSYCLNDRLTMSSDYSEGFVCKKCGSLLSSYAQVSKKRTTLMNHELMHNSQLAQHAKCRVCENSEIEYVSVPYVLRYLTNELAAMNIKLTYTLN